MNKVTIREIKKDMNRCNLDSEYDEAFANTLMELKYIEDSPLDMYLGTEEEQKELERIETMPLNALQIKELMYFMMYKMRDDFQFGRFKKVIKKYLDISEEIRNKQVIKNANKEKPKCNVYSAFGNMEEILERSLRVLKENRMYDEAMDMIEKAVKSYSYDESIKAIKEYVNLVEYKEIVEKEFIFTDADKIKKYCKGNNELINLINKNEKNGTQFKLVLDVDIEKNNTVSSLYYRKPIDEKYIVLSVETIGIKQTIDFLGYTDRNKLVEVIRTEKDELEDEEEL